MRRNVTSSPDVLFQMDVWRVFRARLSKKFWNSPVLWCTTGMVGSSMFSNEFSTDLAENVLTNSSTFSLEKKRSAIKPSTTVKWWVSVIVYVMASVQNARQSNIQTQQNRISHANVKLFFSLHLQFYCGCFMSENRTSLFRGIRFCTRLQLLVNHGLKLDLDIGCHTALDYHCHSLAP